MDESITVYKSNERRPKRPTIIEKEGGKVTRKLTKTMIGEKSEERGNQ